MMVCARCGAPRHPEKERCDYCGSYYPRAAAEPAKAPPPPERPVVVNVYQTNYREEQEPVRPDLAVSPKSRWVCALLCWLLGVVGVHRFYVGKIGSGLFYLFTGGFFGIGWIVDLIRILLGDFRDKDGLKLLR